jgi:hypothetical protein
VGSHIAGYFVYFRQDVQPFCFSEDNGLQLF